MRIRWSTLSAVTLTVACSGLFGPSGEACPQTGEFGSSGCAEVTGQLLDYTGLPLTGRSYRVQLQEPTSGGHGIISAAPEEPDGKGHFRLLLLRYTPPSPIPFPDTATVSVLALFIGAPPGGQPATLVLAPTQVEFVAVGQRPKTSTVVLRVPIE